MSLHEKLNKHFEHFLTYVDKLVFNQDRLAQSKGYLFYWDVKTNLSIQPVIVFKIDLRQKGTIIKRLL